MFYYVNIHSVKNQNEHMYYCLIMKTNPYKDRKFYSNIRDETTSKNNTL